VDKLSKMEASQRGMKIMLLDPWVMFDQQDDPQPGDTLIEKHCSWLAITC
jgi:hypothetical protein